MKQRGSRAWRQALALKIETQLQRTDLTVEQFLKLSDRLIKVKTRMEAAKRYYTARTRARKLGQYVPPIQTVADEIRKMEAQRKDKEKNGQLDTERQAQA